MRVLRFSYTSAFGTVRRSVREENGALIFSNGFFFSFFLRFRPGFSQIDIFSLVFIAPGNFPLWVRSQGLLKSEFSVNTG